MIAGSAADPRTSRKIAIDNHAAAKVETGPFWLRE